LAAASEYFESRIPLHRPRTPLIEDLLRHGEVIGVIIDGARLVTPGLLHFARHGAKLYDSAVVATLGWYLGHDLQSWAVRGGYDQAQEDILLQSIEWPRDGYRLSEIGTMDESSFDGWFAHIGETNALFMRRKLWDSLGGMDERFDAPGGGMVNLDLYRRASDLPGAELVILLGERNDFATIFVPLKDAGTRPQ
jgi:hypothetical protein